MCSIEEAWAGQTFDNKPVISQSDIHNSYSSIPNDVFTRNNEFTVTNSKQPQPRDLTRGINSKYSREPRVPKLSKNTNTINMNISSTTQENNGINNNTLHSPSYMTLNHNNKKENINNSIHSISTNPNLMYPNSTSPSLTQSNTIQHPEPTTTGDNFTNINDAFEVSQTVNKFMNIGMNDTDDKFNNNLLNENTIEEDMIINNKFKNIKKRKNKNRFTNINSKNNISNTYYNNDDMNDDRDDNNMNDTIYDNIDDDIYNNNNNNNNNNIDNIHNLLNDIINKLDKLEIALHNNNKKNMYDLILYILIGMLLSFIIYSTFITLKK